MTKLQVALSFITGKRVENIFAYKLKPVTGYIDYNYRDEQNNLISSTYYIYTQEKFNQLVCAYFHMIEEE